MNKKERDSKYQKTAKGKSVAKKANKKFYESHKKKILECHKQRYYFGNGKITTRISNAKTRGMGYNEICKNPYPKIIKIAYHHINNNDVIPIPFAIHNKFLGHGLTLIQHRELVMEWIKQKYPIDIKEL